MSFNQYEFDRDLGPAGGQMETLGQYTAKTFLWMFLGLMVTFGVGLALFMSQAVFIIFSIPSFPFILLIAEVGVVLFLTARLHKLSLGAARGLFLLYAVLNGVVISSLLLAYGLANAVYVFALTAVYFGAMGAYGYFTKADLSRLRPILFSGLIFLIVMWFVTGFMNIAGMDRIVCLVGIAVFLGFTAYDTNKLRSFYQYYSQDPALLSKASVYFALQLYLDFINLFLYLLRFLGSKKN